MAAAGKLPQLRFLRFFNGHFDDKGVQSLVGLQTLEELVLHSAGVTDASIPAIGKLRNLRVVQLTGSKVTDAGKAQLKTLLPEVEIR